MIDTDSDRFRHDCEVRAVARMLPPAREKYLEGVARARGEKAALRLRNDVIDLLRKAA